MVIHPNANQCGVIDATTNKIMIPKKEKKDSYSFSDDIDDNVV